MPKCLAIAVLRWLGVVKVDGGFLVLLVEAVLLVVVVSGPGVVVVPAARDLLVVFWVWVALELLAVLGVEIALPALPGRGPLVVG